MDDPIALLDGAAKLMRDGALARAMQAFGAIAVAFPKHRGVCLAQIGAAHHQLGEFERAITCYEEAIAAGCDAQIIQDNLDAARDGQMWRRLKNWEGF